MAKLTADGFLDVSSLLVTIPQVVTNTLLTTNNFNVTSMTNINLAANPPTTNVVFGFTSNAVFVPISTNIAPATNVVTIVDTNVVVSTNAQPVQQVQSLYQFGVNGGPNDVVNEIVFGLEEVPYAGGAFTQVDSTNRNGVVKFRSCDPLKANQRIILAGRVYDLTSNLGIPGALVTTPTEITTSAADGTFSLFNLQPGVNLSTVTKDISRIHCYSRNRHYGYHQLGPPLSPIITTNTLRFTLDWFPGPTNMSLGLDTPFTNFPFQVNESASTGVSLPSFCENGCGPS